MTLLSRIGPFRGRSLLATSVWNHSSGSNGNYRRAYSQQSFDRSTSYVAIGAASSLLIGGVLYNSDFLRTAHSKSAADMDFSPPERKDLPMYKMKDVKSHGKGAQRIWVTYKGGVYDITEFVEGHPGGDKILMAAGASVEPFWALYAQHKTAEVAEILESMRIGNLDPKDVEKAVEGDASDPFSTDPKRHPALIVNSQKPFNAEIPPSLLIDHFLTPNDLFFVRNHLPVPEVDKSEHQLAVEGLGVKKRISLSVDDLKNQYEPVSVNSVVQCAGNRRYDMNQFKKVQGLMWEGTAISNAKWTGVRLRDVLITAGLDPKNPEVKHIHLEGADVDPTGQPYGASIPIEKAMSPETIIAYSMNGEDIPRDHGFPLRLIVPGNVGARQVKWLRTIRPSNDESPSHWQQKDYRVFSPSVQMGDEMKWNTVYSIQEYPVQSAFCSPAPGTKVDRASGDIDVAGYAWSGGGRGIIRVEVSADGGKTWQSASLEQDPSQDIDHMWSWTLWRTSVKIPEGMKKVDLLVKATDRAYNTQPESAAGIWNVRGLIHNAWHKVPIEIVD